MLSTVDGKPVAVIKNKNKNIIVYIDEKRKGEPAILINKQEKIFPMPNFDTRDVLYICGPSGSGKSTYASEYIKNFKCLFPDNDVFIFSRLDSDQVLDKLNPIRVKVDESLITDPVDIHKDIGEGDLVLFDDCDTIQDRKMKETISRLKNDILETGRHRSIYVVVTSHLINGNDRKDCRTILNEASSITFFPKSGSTYAINYLLKQYFGMDPKIIKKILSLNTRWITIGKNYPQYIIYEGGIFLL